MAHPRLVYCVEDIFTQCLADYEVGIFRISAYQRGYKWDAEVEKLLDDLREAFASPRQSGPTGEYYLQYITVKRQKEGDEQAFLDVIDGQQRLTTLSLLFAVLAYLQPGFTNVTDGRLEYAVHENFVEKFVYVGHVDRLLQHADTIQHAWKLFTAEHDRYDCQDVWYLFRAARTIQGFLQKAAKQGMSLVDFSRYVARRVMLIVNPIDAHVSSEKVFRNLNSIKVYLTETELIKGLLLTKMAREDHPDGSTPAPREVVEIRHTMGRQWDEMTRWLHRPAVAEFFGPAGLAGQGTEQLLPLLELMARHAGYTGKPAAPRQLYVFTYLQSQLRKARTAAYFFDRLRLLFKLLFDWYETPEKHNLLGFLFFSKAFSGKPQLLRTITDKHWLAAQQLEGKSVTSHLKAQIAALDCLQQPVGKLRYHRDDDAIHDLLLLVNVFPKKPLRERAQRFDFASFGEGAWSLEHVFPQTPERSDLRQLSSQDQARVVELTAPDGQQVVKRLLAQKKHWSERQQEQWSERFELVRDYLDGMGNLALLEGGHNSTLKNALFDKKRRRIVQLISEGAFVPPHTFNVFSRLFLNPGSGSAALWAKKDMREHTTYLANEQARLIRYVTPAI